MNDSGLVDHCLELLSPLGPTRAKRMFSGNALYIDDLCVALIIRDVLYLKVDDTSRALFEAARCKPFTYETKKGERSALSYYTAPEEAMESPHEMIPWARRALAAAVAARAKARPKKAATAGRVAARKTAPTPPSVLAKKSARPPAAAKAAPVAARPVAKKSTSTAASPPAAHSPSARTKAKTASTAKLAARRRGAAS
jgi:DNA transformation protein